MRGRAAAAAAAILLVALTGCGRSETEDGPSVVRPGSPASLGYPPAPAGADRAVVWAVGDAAAPGTAPNRLARLIRRAKPDRFLYLGDVYETGTAQQFRDYYEPRYGRLAPITIPTLGNHEWPNRRVGYYPYWKTKKGHPMQPWFKRHIAGWDILSLNSQAPHGVGSAQVRWLESTLAGQPGTCRIAMWHRPRYTQGGYDSAPDLNPLWNRLAGHASIVLSGHDHNLQRHRPERGLIQYVAGAGGRARYHLRSGSKTMVWGRDDVNGALRIVLKPGLAVLEFRGEGGHVLDRSRVHCSEDQPPAAPQ
jgi:acid phosphatase type 7